MEVLSNDEMLVELICDQFGNYGIILKNKYGSNLP